MKRFFGLCLCIMAVAMIACSSDKSSKGTEYDYSSAKITRAVEDSGPIFENLALTKLPTGVTNGLAGVYLTFKELDLTEPVSTSAQGLSDTNMYAAVYKSVGYFVEILDNNDTEKFDSATAVSAPYTGLEGSGVTYTFYGEADNSWNPATTINYTATWAGNIVEDSENQIEFLLAITAIEPTDPGSSVMHTDTRNVYLNCDTSTGDVLIDLVFTTEITAGAFKGYRLWMDSNMTTKAFKIKGAECSATGIESSFKLVGSNNTGGYMLVEVYGSTSGSSYYKVPGGATVAEMNALTSYTTLAALITAEGDPENYATGFNALSGFTLSELPTSSSKFANGNTILF